jgi:hypothetical protein
MNRITTNLLTMSASAFVIVSGACVLLAQGTQTKAKMFDSPESAAKALIEAASKNDASGLTTILGSAAQGILTSGNATQDQAERQEFSRLASARNRIEHSSMNSASAVLLVGNEDWPFPIPLVRIGQQWHFDPESGAVEMRARRIGGNELDAIEICFGYVTAQETFARQRLAGTGAPVYAQTIMSTPSSKDGLYQPGVSPELVPEGFAMAEVTSGAAAKKPYHDYYFRVLKEQGPAAPGGAHKYVMGNNMIGGFALIAWPAEYGVSGIHTFIVNHDGQVYEKDLGPKTATLSQAMVKYDPDSSWTLVD